LLKESAPSAAHYPTPQREQSFDSDASGLVNADAPDSELASQATNIEKLNMPEPQHGPKPSIASCDAIKNACKSISKLPQKHLLLDLDYVICHMVSRSTNLVMSRSQELI
jgi:hypothetical protein